MQIHLLTLSIVIQRPAQVPLILTSLQQQIQDQVGDHQLLRWAITSVQVEGEIPMATIEAVVTTDPSVL